jgi:two-component system sensor histidine kinase TorS
LFFAFLIIVSLSLTPGFFAWLILRDISDAQTDLSARALPAVVSAQALVELSGQLVAMGPALRKIDNREGFARQEGEFGRLRRRMTKLLSEATDPADRAAYTNELRGQITRLLGDLERQKALVAERLQLGARLEASVARTMAAARDLTNLSETFVSNALALNLAVIAELYKPDGPSADASMRIELLDQLVEKNIYNLQNTAELRLAASQLGLVANKFRSASAGAEIEQTKTDYLTYVETIGRRVKGVADPTRRKQAEQLLHVLADAIRTDASDGGLAGSRSRLVAISAQSDHLAQTAERSAEATRTIALDLLKDAQAASATAASRGATAVTWGLIVLVVSSAAAVGASGYVIWALVERRLIRPLDEVTTALERLSDGRLDVDVDVHHVPDLRQLGRAFRVFRDESRRRRTLEIEQAATNAELLRHKNDLQALVREQTSLLEKANEKLRIEAEEHSAARDEAETANRAKTEFLAVMSHEIRTPMTGMIGMIDLLGSVPLGSEQAQWVESAKRSSRALLRILDSILAYARVEASELVLDLETVDLRFLVENIAALMRPVADAKGIDLIVEMGPELWPFHMCDDGKIQQILANLLSNAIKFSDRGAVRMVVSARDEAGSIQAVRIDVVDEGVGISPEQMDRIFEPFVQADRSITRRYGGTGLGLAISRRLAAIMQGDVSAVSAPNGGSTFSLKLHLERGGAVSDTAAPEAPAGTPVTSCRVLLIEDDDASRTVVSTYLRRLGHEVSAAADGAGAERSAREVRPEIVITDVSLPDVAGPDVVVRLREQLAAPGLPAICMSAHVFPEDVERFSSQGMNAFVAKPLTPKSLQDAIASVLEGAVRANLKAAFDADLAALGPDVMASLVEEGRLTMSSRLNALEQARKAGDGDAIRQIAHAMRSTAGSLNLVPLTEAAERLEYFDAADGTQDLERLISECRHTWLVGLGALACLVDAAHFDAEPHRVVAADR